MPATAREVTGNLDDTQLRALEERLTYLRELEERRAAIVASIEERNEADPRPLKAEILQAETKQRLEPLPAVQAEAPHQGPRSPAKPASRRWPKPC